MNGLHLRIGNYEAAEEIIKAFHYSHRMAGSVQMVGTWHRPGGLFGDFGDVVAAVTFSSPPTRWSEPVWELSRLVKIDGEQAPLSSFLAKTIAFLKRSRDMDLIVSFADWTQGHHGGIYQACSWDYAGKRDRAIDGIVVNGQFVPGRTCNARWGTRSPRKLAERGINCEPHYDEGKHLYWKALSPSGKRKAERLGLSSFPYPKPAEQTSLIDGNAA